jgi:hypothetical protein
MPYGETVKMEEVNNHHMYTADDKGYPSVTTILDVVAYSKYLMRWANNLGFNRVRYEDELNRTSTQGTFVHEMNQCLVDPEHGVMPSIKDPLTDYRVRKRVNHFSNKLKENEGHWRTIFAETPFVSHTYEIGGTMDWYAEWYQKETIFDYKTSSGLREKHILQLGGYYLLLSDNGFTPEQSAIILCKEDRCIFNFFDREIMERCANIFLDVYSYYKQHPYLTDVINNRATIV